MPVTAIVLDPVAIGLMLDTSVRLFSFDSDRMAISPIRDVDRSFRIADEYHVVENGLDV